MEAIILAGGLGTRLRSEVKEIPKSMAPIQNRPFLEYQLDYFIAQGVTRFIFSLGYKAQSISEHFGANYKGARIDYAVEETQLGTGGAIKNAMQFVNDKHVVVLNGDSLFKCNVQQQLKQHLEKNADVTLALKPLKNFDRYGTVTLNEEQRILSFEEKKQVDEGLINGGVYVFKVEKFNTFSFPEKFSIEKDFFESKVDELNLQGFISQGYFLDIGIPKDFAKAQFEIAIFPNITKDWTLFLDRDGVINRKRDNDYVKSISELEILPNALQSIAKMSTFFGRVFIVTNQQGVGKGLMSMDDLESVHQHLENELLHHGCKIDQIYAAPQLASEHSIMRKPNIGMALKAKEEFPEIEMEKSIMIGDSKSDIEFAMNAGMVPVKVIGDKEENSVEKGYYSTKSLHTFSELVANILED